MNNTNRDKWLKDRQKGIGSSDIGAIIGVNKYNEPYDIYLQKVEGLVIPDNDAMKRGRYLEDSIPLFFKDITGYNCRRPEKEIYYNADFPEKPFLATPDFYYTDEAGIDCIFEAKTYVGYLTGVFEDDLDESYYAQLQWQLHNTGIKRGTIGILAGGFKFFHYTFDYDPEYCKELEKKALDFWINHVATGIPPQPLSKRTNELKYPEEEQGKVIQASEEFIEKHNKFIVAQDKAKRLKEFIDNLKDELCLMTADAETVIYADSRLATYKVNKAGSRVFRAYDT